MRTWPTGQSPRPAPCCGASDGTGVHRPVVGDPPGSAPGRRADRRRGSRCCWPTSTGAAGTGSRPGGAGRAPNSRSPRASRSDAAPDRWRCRRRYRRRHAGPRRSRPPTGLDRGSVRAAAPGRPAAGGARPLRRPGRTCTGRRPDGRETWSLSATWTATPTPTRPAPRCSAGRPAWRGGRRLAAGGRLRQIHR